MKLQRILFLFFLGSFSLLGQQNRNFLALSKENNSVKITTTDGYYKIKPINSYIVETEFVPNGQNAIDGSHAVVLPSTELFKIEEQSAKINLKTSGIEVEILKSPFNITYLYKGKKLVSEKEGYSKKSEFEQLSFQITPDEILYGGGARALGMNRRGYRLQLYNRAHYGYETHSELMNYTMPLVFSSKNYALHFDNEPIGYLDLDSQKKNEIVYETISGKKKYQVIGSDNIKDVVTNYVKLTGKQPMIPRWALGNFASRFGYHSQREVENTIDLFEAYKIPVDAIILDLYWFGKDIKGTMGNLEFYKDSFPNPSKMITTLKEKGIKTILISEPFILTTSSKWEEAVEKKILGFNEDGSPFTYDFYFGNTGIIDIFNPIAEQWFWDFYKLHTEMGVAGWWGDLGEPEVHPSALLHKTGTADEVHNVYGHYWAKLVFDGYQRDFLTQRPFILMRAGYSGSQRFGMIPWSGDVNRTWGGLQSQVEIALQMGMQGLAYMHSDLGGFAGANLDDELYSRWLQYGVFQPIFRPHAQEEVPSEPVFREPKTRELAKKAIELRYQLLPYNYNLSYENATTGMPLMRPLLFEETNEKTLTNKETYLWGDSFLVTPITESELVEKQIYFPAQNNWYNFYTGQKRKGGIYYTEKLSKEFIPVYVRGGSFVPMIDVIQNTEKYNLSSFMLHYYADDNISNSSYSLYNDDGKTPDAKVKEEYEILTFNAQCIQNKMTFKFESEIGQNYKPKSKTVKLIIHNVKSTPTKLRVNGKRTKEFNFNNSNNQLVIPIKWNSKQPKDITIKFKE